MTFMGLIPCRTGNERLKTGNTGPGPETGHAIHALPVTGLRHTKDRTGQRPFFLKMDHGASTDIVLEDPFPSVKEIVPARQGRNQMPIQDCFPVFREYRR